MSLSATEIDNELFTGLSKVNAEGAPTTCCKITTMTILLQLNEKIALKNITESNLIEILENNSDLKCVMSTTKKFNNCIIVKCIGDRNITVKIFSNGNLHMTGAKSAEMAMFYGHLFCNSLSQLFSQSFCITLLTIQLINACCRFNLDSDVVLSLNAFKKYVSESRDLPNVVCFYNNDQHAGLRIKIPYQRPNGTTHTSTCIVFSSGSVLFNAFLSGNELEHAYSFVRRVYLQNYAELVVTKLNKSQPYIQDFDYNHYLTS
jgi:TATA-box binding protein (TBP) (component of TFIID and TFIIIB)